MKALVYEGPRKVVVKDMPDARIEQFADVVVKITTTNICGSDLHMYEGYKNFDEREEGWTKVVLKTAA
jgi:threonine dehydrogenase-like Zn-dependent dehydrogenase